MHSGTNCQNQRGEAGVALACPKCGEKLPNSYPGIELDPNEPKHAEKFG